MANATPDSRTPAQVQRHHQHDGGHAEEHLVLGHDRDRGADVRHRRRRRNSYGENVIHHQGTRDDEAGRVAEVGGDHLEVATARRVGMHVLPVAGHHDQHDRGHS